MIAFALTVGWLVTGAYENVAPRRSSGSQFGGMDETECKDMHVQSSTASMDMCDCGCGSAAGRVAARAEHIDCRAVPHNPTFRRAAHRPAAGRHSPRRGATGRDAAADRASAAGDGP